MTEHEQRAFDYLKRVSGLHIAEWAFQEKNGTWLQAMDLTAAG